MGFDSNPNFEAVVTFVSGVSSEGKVAEKSAKTFVSKSDPATYNTETAYSFKWGSPSIGAPGGNVTFAFDSGSKWSLQEQQVIGAGLALWSALTNITFTNTDNPKEANQLFVRNTDADTNFQQLTKSIQRSPIGSTSVAQATASKIVFNTAQKTAAIDGNFEKYGGWPWQTVLHEEGHALGLSHGGTYVNGKPFSLYQLNAFDTRAWTVMSYLSPTEKSNKFYSDSPIETDWGLSGDALPYRPTTPMMIDIAAVQRLYGTPTSGPLASGGQVFGFHTNIDDPVRQFFDFTVNKHPVITIWDGGTNNTLDLSGFPSKSIVNLNSGSFSSANGVKNNIAIAPGTVIEKAVTGPNDDVIIGSSANNIFVGNGANDIIDGGAGVDTAIFAGQRSQYTLIDLGNGSVRVSGPDGTDTLTNVELLKFDDQVVSWPLAGSGTADYADSITDLLHPVGYVPINGSAASNLEVTGDRDLFAVELATVTTYRIEATGIRGGSGILSSSHVRIIDHAGAVVAETEGGSNSAPDSKIDFRPLTPGTYFIEVAALGSIPTGTYRISVSNGTAAGGDDFADTVTDAAHPFGLVSVEHSSIGILETAADRDWFRADLTAGMSYTFSLAGNDSGGAKLEDPYLRLHDNAGLLIAENDDIVPGSNKSAALTLVPTVTGTYYVEVGSYQDSYTGVYTLDLTAHRVGDDFAEITKLYAGYCDRAPDADGAAYWVEQLQGGRPLAEVAYSFSAQKESTGIYGFLANPNADDAAAVETFVATIYANLVGRNPDPAGAAYWVAQLKTGASPAGRVILDIISGSRGNDARIIENKATVGHYYAAETLNNGVQATSESARNALADVDYTDASVLLGQAKVDALVSSVLEDVPVVGVI